MMQIKHACDAIKAEAIKVILVHPESEVAQQEPKNLMMSVVEQSAIPELMSSFGALVEVLMIGAVKLIEPIKNVLRCVAVDNVEQHRDAHTVCGVHQLFQVFRGAIPTACSEEVVDLVSKAGIVCMFHNGHQLDYVVAQGLDSWKHVLGKLLVGCDPQLGGGNSHMGLVYTKAFWLFRARVLENIAF